MSLSLTASVVHCMSSDISENNDPYFVGLKKLLFFQSFLPMKFTVCKCFFCKCDNVSKWIISCWAWFWFCFVFFKFKVLFYLPWRALIVQSYTSFLQYLWHLIVVALYFFAVGTKSMKILVNVSAKQNYQIFKKDKKLFLKWNPWMTKMFDVTADRRSITNLQCVFQIIFWH